MNEGSGKLKVGLVSPYAWTSRWGVNRHIGGLAAALAAAGHDVTVIAPSEERQEARSARRQARAARRTTRGSRSTRAGKPSLTQEFSSPIADVSASLPYRLVGITGTYRFPYSDSLANLALPLEVTEQVNSLLESERFDILHVHEPYPPSLSFTALRLAHCPTVATFHTAGERFLSYQLMRPVVERFFTRLDGRICTSNNTRRMVSSYFPGEYTVIGSGVDSRRFSAAEPTETVDPLPLVIFAAWSDPRKGQGLLARAVRLLPDDVPPFRLAIVGGEELAWRERLLVPRRLRERVRFSGVVSEDDLPDAYSQAEILCAPYAASSLSSAVLEAMACGVAVIVPGQGGIKELVGESNEGLLLDHPYAYSLAASIVDLLHEHRERRSLGAASARKAARFSWDRIAPRVEKTYHKAHRRRRRAKPQRSAIDSVRGEDTILADLHMHTSHSGDCATTPRELLDACEESGLKAIAITDHNTITGALEVADLAPADIHVIVGEEIKTREGEIIGLYLTSEIPRGLSAEDTIVEIRKQGGLVYVPHPFDPMHLTPTYELLARNAADIDIIEVYNPRITFTSFNEKAKRLARKYDIPGGAGSDCHVVQGVGTAMLSLRRFNKPEELLASLREADIIRSSKSPLYLHSLKLLKSSRIASGPGN
ncbi:MAG: glycosyltransferase [Thermoleophilia bacterium]|nr:glycosyltransferase [Thermoleophilia bacterium]